MDLSTNNPSTISRRAWFGKAALPTMGALGMSAIGLPAAAGAPNHHTTEEKRESNVKIFNIRDHGAVGDGTTLDTVAIQRAIDTCHRENGGTVLIPSGTFLSGTLELKSNVTLYLAKAARLLGSPRREDYTAGNGVPSGNGNIVFIYAVNAENISIEGSGTLDGNGLTFYNGKGDNTGPGQGGVGGNFDRPHLAIFYKCNQLRLRDGFYTASAYHCFRILQCKQVYIDSVRIYNRVNKNNDGFHFNSCEYVHLSNSDVQCQDDACALFGSNKFVTVNNCSFSTRWSIFRFGGGASQNIAVTNCLIYETYGCPIKISAGNAQIENFTFSNIMMRNVTGPIGIGFSGKSNNNNAAATEKPFIRNIVFNNIRATVVAQPVNHPDIHFGVNVYPGEKNSCITLNAMDDVYLENISFTDVHVKYAGGGTAAQAAKVVPNVAAEYFGVWNTEPSGPPAYGLYARNVKGLTLQNVRFEYNQPEERPAIVFDHVQDAAITGLSVQGSPDVPVMRVINSKDLLTTAARVLSPAAAFVQVEGEESEGIIIDGGDLRKAKKAVAFMKNVASAAAQVRS